MTNVYLFPPVGVVSSYWTMEQPVSRSTSLLTGASYVSAAQRRRILAGIDVHGRRHYGSGRMEALWRLMDGVHLVKITSCKIPWGRTVANRLRGGGEFDWAVEPDSVFGWETPPEEFVWFQGVDLSFEGYGNTVVVSGLPPLAIVAVPGEFVEIFSEDESESERIMISSVGRSNSLGVASFLLVRAPFFRGRISIGARETGVFEMTTDWQRVRRYAGYNEDYSLEFRQVFEDERGPFVEVNPWT